MSVRTSIIEILKQNNGVHFGFLFKKIEPRNTSYLEIARTIDELRSDGILSVDGEGKCYLCN